MSGGLEPILRYFLEANGFRNYGSFLNTKFTDEMAERMEKFIRSLKEPNKYYQIMTDWYDEEPLSEFKLLEGWKSSLKTVFIAMNACDASLFGANVEKVGGGGIASFDGKLDLSTLHELLNLTFSGPKRQNAQINPIILQQTSKRYKHDESDPNFIHDLIAKFQTKIFTKLKECDANLKIKDKSDITVNYVSEMDNGKKFEVKCVYCPSSLGRNCIKILSFMLIFCIFSDLLAIFFDFSEWRHFLSKDQ